jgi:hypothetical protein
MSSLQSRGPSLLGPCRALWSNKHTSASEYGFGRLWEFQVEILVRKFRIPDRTDICDRWRCSPDDLLQWKDLAAKTAQGDLRWLFGVRVINMGFFAILSPVIS